MVNHIRLTDLKNLLAGGFEQLPVASFVCDAGHGSGISPHSFSGGGNVPQGLLYGSWRVSSVCQSLFFPVRKPFGERG